MSAVEDIKATSSELLTAPPAKALLRFALPLMAGGACQQIYALTDAAVVGRVLGVNALSALGACDLLVWLVGASLGAFTQGFSIRLSTAFGAGDRELFCRTAATSYRISVGGKRIWNSDK